MINPNDYVCDVEDGMPVLGNGIFDNWPKYGDPAFKVWCEANNVYYYARPGYMFKKSEAIQLAKESGAHYLIWENMS